ncbi:hypothetical protein, partial [Lactococcus sp. UBA7157]|uniref:hypothetical protein n=1 Tax=Lactococcus sp. UBA7157 TaxID=1946734 RepID=UPI00257B918D
LFYKILEKGGRIIKIFRLYIEVINFYLKINYGKHYLKSNQQKLYADKDEIAQNFGVKPITKMRRDPQLFSIHLRRKSQKSLHFHSWI